jgi:outer membrane protein assembly factor BamD (BamD/ComL family)
MKKEKTPDPLLGKSGLRKVVMMIMFSLFCFAVSAQTAQQNSIKETNAKLEEFIKHHPDDAYAKKALKDVMILENPAAFPEFTQFEMDRIKTEYKNLVERCNYVDQQMRKGVTYEAASEAYQAQMDRQATRDKKTTELDKSGKPVQKETPVMTDGNN